jgi:hypothetical protein
LILLKGPGAAVVQAPGQRSPYGFALRSSEDLKGKSARVMGKPGFIYRRWFGGKCSKNAQRNILGFATVHPIEPSTAASKESETKDEWLKNVKAYGARRLDVAGEQGRNGPSCDCNGAMSSH